MGVALPARGPLSRGARGGIDNRRLGALRAPARAERAAELSPDQRRGFIAPPWREIFEQDAERKQDFAEAQATYQAMVAVYTGLGYELVTLPLVPLPERARFVRAHLMAGNDSP